MAWNDMIWYDMQWYAMICNDMVHLIAYDFFLIELLYYMILYVIILCY